MNRGKNAQITLFLVMSLLVILALYVIYTSMNQASRGAAPIAMPAAQTPLIEPETIRLYMQGCYETLANMDLIYFGMLGTHPDFNHPTTGAPEYYTIVYDKGTMSLNQNPEAALANYLDSLLPLCVMMTGYQEAGIELTAGTPKTKVMLRDKDVVFQTEYPVTAHSKTQTVTAKNLATSVPARIGYLMSVTKTIIDNTHADPDHFNLTLMNSFDLNVTAAMIDNHTAGYRLLDPKSKVVPDAPYELLFAVRT